MLDNILNLVDQLEAKYGLKVPTYQAPEMMMQPQNMPPQLPEQFKAAEQFKQEDSLAMQDYEQFANDPTYGPKLEQARVMVENAQAQGIPLDESTIQAIMEEVMSS